jgi:CheY-like chemotaxis protein
MPRRILIVEDDTSIAQTLMMALRALPDVEVERAYDGATALELWKASPADLVITDHNMRQMTGLELIQQLRKDGATQPILMITAYDTVQLKREAREAGVTELIAKPFFVELHIEHIVEPRAAAAP